MFGQAYFFCAPDLLSVGGHMALTSTIPKSTLAIVPWRNGSIHVRDDWRTWLQSVRLLY